ncbi:MAG: HPr family phosphocarrier protein [Burkholderiaceae bacterium]|nr:HPr family phosphocarrier protein [Burkholderiaceae bacterium]
MLEAETMVVNRLGLHARPSAKLTRLAGQFQAEIWLTCKGRRINAKSIMGVMMLAAAKGSTLQVEAEGPDEAAAVAAVCALFAAGFDEDSDGEPQ